MPTVSHHRGKLRLRLGLLLAVGALALGAVGLLRFALEATAEERAVRALEAAGAWVVPDRSDPEDSGYSVIFRGGDSAGAEPVRDAHLELLPRLRGVRSVAIFRSSVTDAGVQHLAGLTELRKLLLSSEAVTDRGLRQLTGLTGLRELSLFCPQVTTDGLAALAELTALEELHVSLPEERASESLEHLRGLSALRRLSLSGRPAPRPTVSLAPLADLPRLEHLSLENIHLGEGGLAPVARLRSLSLRPSASGLTGDDFRHLQGLEELLAYSPLTEEQFAAIGELRGLVQLRLARSGDGEPVTDANLAQLAGLSNLELLHLGGQTSVTDAGLAPLAGLRNLRELRLASTSVRGAGLAALAGMTQLTDLSLWGTPLTDAGLAHLEALPALSSVDLRGTEVTEEGVRRLRGRRPGLEVWVNGG